MAIITLEEARGQLNRASSVDDATIQFYIDGTKNAVETHLRRVVEQREITEKRTLPGFRVFRLWQRPVISLTSIVSVDGTITYDVSSTAMDLTGEFGRVDVLSGATVPCGRVVIVYQAGTPAVDIPENYKLGALIILQHNWELKRGNVRGSGAVEDGAYDPRYGFAVPHRAQQLLGPRRPLAG